MPSLRPRTRLTLLATALAGLGAAAGAPPPPTLGHQKVTVDATSSEVDYKSHNGTFENVKISQGNITVIADTAHAIGYGEQSSQWILEGHVRVHAPPRGDLSSDKAVAEVLDNHITEVTVTGNPAQFTQQGASAGKITQGHADEIIYDVQAGTVQLNTDAWLSDGRNAFSGPQIGYNILKDRIQATSRGPGERVHITISPRTPPARSAKPPAAARPASRPPGRPS